MRWKDEHGVVIVRDGDEIYAVLGGSTGRPPERIGVSLSPLGRLVVDKARTWNNYDEAPVVRVPAEVAENLPGACDPDDEDCMNVVYTHPSGGKLWQGGNTACRVPGELDRHRIRCVVLAATEFQPKLPARLDVVRAHLEDRSDMDTFTTIAVARCADEVSDIMADRLRRGQSVLSSCWAGLNRSALMTAFTVMKLTGARPSEVIRAIRRARGPRAVSNHVFEKIILSYRPRVVR